MRVDSDAAGRVLRRARIAMWLARELGERFVDGSRRRGRDHELAVRAMDLARGSLVDR